MKARHKFTKALTVLACLTAAIIWATTRPAAAQAPTPPLFGMQPGILYLKKGETLNTPVSGVQVAQDQIYIQGMLKRFDMHGAVIQGNNGTFWIPRENILMFRQ